MEIPRSKRRKVHLTEERRRLRSTNPRRLSLLIKALERSSYDTGKDKED
jgi:hypothetical protein